jgi:hypothetical protein
MKRKYRVQSNYFANIQSEEQAYFLGLFFADGCNVTGNNEIRLQLQASDRSILDIFQTRLQPERPLLTSKRNGNEYVLLVACHRNLSRDLRYHGATEKKTTTLKFPDHLPQHLMQHFIRGHFDGDGCLYFRYQRDKKYPHNTYLEGRITIVGPPTFCHPLADYIESKLGFKPNFYPRYKSGIGEFVITGNKRIRQFLVWLYNDATIFLPRKYQKMQDFFAAPTAIKHSWAWLVAHHPVQTSMLLVS